MAGVDVALGGDGHVFVARAAALDALFDARPAVQIDHEVEEVHPRAVLAPLEVDFGKAVVLGEDLRQHLLGQREGGIFLQHHRLDGELLKALVSQRQHVVAKVEVAGGVGAAHVVLPVAAQVDQLLRPFHGLVERALAVDHGAHVVVHLAAAVDGEDDVVHLAVQKLDALVGQAQGVGGDGELEMLVVLLFQLAGVEHQVVHHVVVHQRFAAEEVHLQLMAVAGMGHQPVERFLARLQRQKRALAVEVARGGKAVAAAQVAVVRRVQAHGLDDAGLADVEV